MIRSSKLFDKQQLDLRLWGPIRVPYFYGSIPSRSPIFNASWFKQANIGGKRRIRNKRLIENSDAVMPDDYLMYLCKVKIFAIQTPLEIRYKDLG